MLFAVSYTQNILQVFKYKKQNKGTKLFRFYCYSKAAVFKPSTSVEPVMNTVTNIWLTGGVLEYWVYNVLSEQEGEVWEENLQQTGCTCWAIRMRLIGWLVGCQFIGLPLAFVPLSGNHLDGS